MAARRRYAVSGWTAALPLGEDRFAARRHYAVRGWTAALPLVVAVPMLAAASAFGTSDVVFPEGAALAMGIWVVNMPGWSASRWRVAVLPPAFALAGVALIRLGLPASMTTILGVTLALLALQALDSRLAPALSAAVLPIVFDVRAWAYPLAVLAISLVVAIGMARSDGTPGRWPWRVVVGAWLVIVGWILGGGELLGVSSVALAPPLFVSALEWLGAASMAASDGLRRWAVLVGAALAGASAVELVPVGWIAGTLAVVATLALMRVLATAVPPALAIALIPQILESTDPAGFTFAIALGAGALYLGVYGVRWRPSGRKLVGVQDGEHRELMIAAIGTEGEAHAALLAGDHAAARAAYAKAVEQYRASWKLAPPKSYGRLVGLLKAAVLAGEANAAATEVRAELDGDADAEGSPVASYVLATAAVILGDDDEAAVRAARMEPRGEAFERTATALRALAARDADGYAAAITAIEADFAAREDHLTGVAIADTAVMLELLAAERGMAVKPSSPLVPAI